MSEPLRVLIVDDEAPARARLKALLADIAAELPNECVGEAANGIEALDRLAASPADVALVDIRMQWCLRRPTTSTPCRRSS